MDKSQFIQSAPRYYALAIISYLNRDQSATTKSQIVEHFSYPHPDDPNDIFYRVTEGKLLDIAIRILAEDELVTLEYDDFGPPLIVPIENLWNEVDQKWRGHNALYDRYMRVGRARDGWLFEALDNLLKEEQRLQIEDNDYETPEQEWNPIPVDRNEVEVLAVIDAVEDATEKIRSDNGYSATRPEERNYVIDGLTLFGKRLRETTTISIPYLRQYAIDPLMRAGKSLGKSVAGLAVEALKARIREWLMNKGIPWPFDWP